MLKDAFALDYGAKHFFRADYKQASGDGTLYVALAFTIFRGYFIGETIMAKSPEDLDMAASSLRGISFRDDKPNPECVMNADERLDSTDAAHTPGPSLYRSPSSDPLPIFVSSLVSTGLLTKKIPPQYPENALKHRVQGRVVIGAVVDKHGDVEDASLVSGHPMLAPAAIEAVKQWKYRPYLLNGQPVKIETRINVVFQLNGQ